MNSYGATLALITGPSLRIKGDAIGGRLGAEAGMEHRRYAGLSGRSGFSKASCTVASQPVQPEQSSDQPGRSIWDSWNR